MNDHIASHYRRMLSGTPADGLENTDDGAPADLSDPAIHDRLAAAKAELHRIVTDYLGDRSELHDLARALLAEGGEALRMLRDGGDELDQRPELLDGLETVVRTDGSRPSFMVRDGEPDRSTSPLGKWGDYLDTSADFLREAISCVGRIELQGSPHEFEGTGFLVHENLVITNRHVLQMIADLDDAGRWHLRRGATIDFGREFRARDSVAPRRLRRVVFCGSEEIMMKKVEHAKLDLALIELESIGGPARPRDVLSVDLSPDWAEPKQVIYTVGYPGRPAVGSAIGPTLVEQLFQSTFGCKRLSPGLVMTPQAPVHTWTLAHDATTLWGSSGSLVLVAGRERAAAGLHYGGRSANPRENWGHVLGRVLDEPTGCSTDPNTRREDPTTLREHLRAFGVSLVDRITH